MIALKRKTRLTVTKGDAVVFVSGDLRVDFEVNQMVGDALNTSRITVYNLSPTCVQTLSVRDAPIKVKLEVGRAEEEQLTTLFEGDLINIHHTPMFSDSLTQMWCWQRGGAAAQESPKPAKTYSNMTVRAIATSIVQSLVDAEGNPVASISFEKVVGDDLDRIVPSFVHTKNTDVALRDLLQRYNLQYANVGGVYQVSNVLTKEGQVEEMVIAIDNGTHLVRPNLLKKPVQFSIATAVVVVELDPSYSPLDFFAIDKDPDIQSVLGYSEGLLKLAEGVTNITPRDNYQILKVTHRGSCYTDEWETETKGIIYVNSVKE